MNIPHNDNNQDCCFLSNDSSKNTALRSTNNLVSKMLVTLDAIAEAVLWVNQAREIQWFNHAFEQLVARSEQDILGVKLIDILPLSIDGQSVNLEAYPDVKIQLGEYQTREYQFIQAEKSLVLEISGYCTEDDDNTTTSILIIRKNEALSHNLEVANRAKSQFLANMSHEFRTPLNAILGFTQLMARDEAITPKQQKSLSIIHKSGEHLLHLINDLLEMSKIETGQTKLQPKVFSLHRMLHDLKVMFQPLAQAKQLSLQFESARGLVDYISTDEIKLRQVLINLLDNAIKFTHTGSVTLRVLSLREIPIRNISLTSDQVKLIFEVEDTGIGIAGKEMERIFQPFAQIATDIYKLEGAGLGLAISQHFVSLMGGKINLISSLEEGSKFSFGIKVDLASPLTEEINCYPNQAISLASVQPQAPQFLNRQALSCMTPQWIAQLYQAAIAVDADIIKQLVAEIPPTHQFVATALETLIGNYDFDRIVELSNVSLG